VKLSRPDKGLTGLWPIKTVIDDDEVNYQKSNYA